MIRFMGLPGFKAPLAATAVAGLLLVILSYACGDDPREAAGPARPARPPAAVVERIVEVEVPVEVVREVVKEVPVEVNTPIPTPDIEATVEAMLAVRLATHVPVTPSPVSTSVPTVQPTATPTPRPTATPVPVVDIRQARTISAGGGLWDDATISIINTYGHRTTIHGYLLRTVHSCALNRNGEAICWGRGDPWSERGGYEGDEYPDINSFFKAHSPAGRFTMVSSGGAHTCALTEQDRIFCWRQWDDRRWDQPEYGQTHNPPGEFQWVSAGKSHTCGLREDGTAACWGLDGYGRTEVPEGKFVAISAGWWHTCGLRRNGDAECWGRDHEGQAEDMLGQRFVAISAGGTLTCALRADGTGACWGNNSGVPALDGPFKMISVGHDHACALYEDDTATCWGEGGHGQTLPPSGQFSEIVAGFEHSCGVRVSGEVVCWGSNEGGESSPPGIVVMKSTPEAESPASHSSASVDAASILARFSTSDPLEGERRSDAVAEIIAHSSSGITNPSRILDLLHVIAPELSIDERSRSVTELASISKDSTWDEHETANGVFYLATLITGDEPNAGERIEAAHELVVLYEVGELDAGRGLDLMNMIAPSLHVNERRQATAALAKLSADDDWDDEDKLAAASEVFRLVTGVPLAAEERMGAAVDLAGLGVKVFGSGEGFDDADVDIATVIIKEAVSGYLTGESLQHLLETGN